LPGQDQRRVIFPLAFIDADHAAGVAGDAVVGEEVGRVCEDEVDAGFRDGGEDVEAVALEDFDVVLGVVEDGGGEYAFAKASARHGSGFVWASAFAEASARHSAFVWALGRHSAFAWAPAFAKASARQVGEIRSGFGHGLEANDDQVGSLIEW
jgi:hypothetical protein